MRSVCCLVLVLVSVGCSAAVVPPEATDVCGEPETSWQASCSATCADSCDILTWAVSPGMTLSCEDACVEAVVTASEEDCQCELADMVACHGTEGSCETCDVERQAWKDCMFARP